MSRSLKSLMERLNPTSRRTLEAAAGLCLSQTHYEVEIEHWLQRLLDETDSDLRRICDHFEVDASRMM